MVSKVTDNFDTVSISKLRSDGKKAVDLSMYTGSGGILYGIYKYIELLRSEDEKVNPYVFKHQLEQENQIKDPNVVDPKPPPKSESIELAL